MRKLLLLSACLMASVAVALADDKDKKDDKTKSEPTIEVSEIAINRKVETKAHFGNYDGTRIAFVLRYPGKHLLGVDKTSKLASMKDDKGNALLNEKDAFSGGISTYPQVADDGSAMLVGISSYSKSPGKGASKVLIKGELVVRCGSEEKSEQIKKVKFKEKEKATGGDFEVTVTRDKEGFGADGAAFIIKTKFQSIKGVVVKDGDGKEFAVVRRGWFSDGDKRTFNFALSKPLEEGTIHVTYFSKEDLVKVPLDLSVGLDLGR